MMAGPNRERLSDHRAQAEHRSGGQPATRAPVPGEERDREDRWERAAIASCPGSSVTWSPPGSTTPLNFEEPFVDPHSTRSSDALLAPGTQAAPRS